MANALSLSELNLLIKDTLAESFPESVWVVAEISELKENRSGHCYLELIEKDGTGYEILARTRATIWSYTFRMLKPYFETTTGQLFAPGIKVLVLASIEFHPAFGLSLNIRDIDPAYTAGDMALQRNRIIEQLKAAGIFDMNKELPLPLVPQNIAVISSATAAGYLDFTNQLENNRYGFCFSHKLFEAYMQGSEAVPSIISALERIYETEGLFDVVVLIRGGGAQSDLSCFDNFDLASHIAQFPLPVITGIGHEKDDTIADMVAHTRLKTPTAVAEFLITGVAGFYERLAEAESRIVEISLNILERENQKLNSYASAIVHSGQFFLLGKQNRLSQSGQKFRAEVSRFSFEKNSQLAQLGNNLSSGSSRFLSNNKNRLHRFGFDIQFQVEKIFLKKSGALQRLGDALKSHTTAAFQSNIDRISLLEKSATLLNPENILKRGFTLTFKNGSILKTAEGLQEGDIIETRFRDGQITSKITKK